MTAEAFIVLLILTIQQNVIIIPFSTMTECQTANKELVELRKRHQRNPILNHKCSHSQIRGINNPEVYWVPHLYGKKT